MPGIFTGPHERERTTGAYVGMATPGTDPHTPPLRLLALAPMLLVDDGAGPAWNEQPGTDCDWDHNRAPQNRVRSNLMPLTPAHCAPRAGVPGCADVRRVCRVCRVCRVRCAPVYLRAWIRSAGATWCPFVRCTCKCARLSLSAAPCSCPSHSLLPLAAAPLALCCPLLLPLSLSADPLFFFLFFFFFFSLAVALLCSCFNIQIFGKSKMAKVGIAPILAKIVARYDLLVVQEIRDKDGDAITELLASGAPGLASLSLV